MYKEWVVGENSYKLKLSTAAIVDLEAKLNRPLITIFGYDKVEIPTIKTMALVLQAAIGYEKQISMSNVYSLIDAFFEEGKKLADLTEVIRGLFVVSGLIEDESVENEDEKN